MNNKQSILVIFLVCLFSFIADAQQNPASSPTREERYAKLESKLVFPLIKGSKMTGVIPVENASNKPDANKEVKLIFDFTQSTANNAQGQNVNEGLEEVGRIMNLHIAAGTKKEKLKTVIIFHSGSILSILNDASYQKKYGNANPNNNLFEQLNAAGTELIVCGQSLQLRDVNQKDLQASIQVALSAITTLTKYQQKGYLVFLINEKP